MVVLRALLFPFSILYDLVTRIRNYLFDIGHKRSFRFETTVISVGNLNVGGSGKTPMIEYLIRRLLPSYRLATLSRGYGRKTRGMRFAGPTDTALTLGDEPFQFYRKFGDHVMVTVGEDRALAIPNILQSEPSPSIILLDDAFQHRQVEPQLSILLTDYQSPFFNDYVLPAGNLRESRRGAKRSHIVVVTKCPDSIVMEQRRALTDSIRKYAPEVPVFFTKLVYNAPVAFEGGGTHSDEVVLVTGLANTEAIETYAARNFKVLRHLKFNDHHRYTAGDVKEIQDAISGSNATVLTTEKDMVKLIADELRSGMEARRWFYLPIQVSFVENGSEFDSMVLHSITK